MKIVFNTKNPNAASSEFYYAGFSKSGIADFNIYSDLEHYDIAIHMTYPDDLKELKKIKKKYPLIKMGIADPRGDFVKPYLKYADFLLVDSIEMYDYWQFAKKPIFRYVEYPDIPYYNKVHTDKKKFIIGYHGNLVHLNSSIDTALLAIRELSTIYDIELRIMYNIDKLGKWNSPITKKIKTTHIQWSMDNYTKYLADCDIGIVPNILLTDKMLLNKKKLYKKNLNYRDDDYIIRFKMSSNPGRIIIFARLGIPVISEFYPSAMQYIQDDYDGYLVNSKQGWYNALEKLILDRSKRQAFSDRMKSKVKQYDFTNQNIRLINDIKTCFNL